VTYLVGPILPYLDEQRCSTCQYEAEAIRQPPCSWCQRQSEWLPRQVFLYRWELESMDEYSRTLPTGTTIGKVWRRAGFESGHGVWVVGVYARALHPAHRGQYCRILWLEVVYKHGPAPRQYSPPDWSNYSGWLKEHRVQ